MNELPHETGLDHPKAPEIEAAAARIIEAGWRADDSAFTPGRPVWTAAAADELHSHLVEPSGISNKRFVQIVQRKPPILSAEAIQLVAELRYLNVLPLSDMNESTKRSEVEALLSACPQPVSISIELTRALGHPGFRGGPGFKTHWAQQVKFLIEAVRRWKSLDPSDRPQLVSDPWGFKDFVLKAPGPPVGAQRNALLFLAFPAYFENIVSHDDKGRIRAAFNDYIDDPTGDVDRDLLTIRKALEQEHGGPINFYISPWRARWHGEAGDVHDDPGDLRIRWTGMGRPGAPDVEDAARKFLDVGWLNDDSVLTPGTPVWTAENLAELHTSFVEAPGPETGSFVGKLEVMFENISDEAIQLMAELILLNVLPLSNVGGDAKRRLIDTVLGWSKTPISIPSELASVLDVGVWNGGAGFNVGRPDLLEYLIRIIGSWKALTHERRRELLDNAWAFQDFIMSEVREPRVPAQRNALLYLFFPHYFEPIGPAEHKRKIRNAFLEYCSRPTGDVDRDLLAIHVALEKEHDGPIDFYRPPFAQRWQGSKRAWLVRGASVAGRNLVPIWLEEGFCSLAATHLPPVEPGMSHEELERIVEESYSDGSYNARAEKVNEFFPFLSRMKAGDVVVATSEGKVYLGSITGEAGYAESPDGRFNLRRTVEWRNSNQAINVAELPAPLPARLSVQHDVVELTEQLEILQTLMDGNGKQNRLIEAVLSDATEELADSLLVEHAWLQESVELLRDRRQLIYYGPPGTGKTYIAQELARHLAGRENTKLVQFHPAYSYEDFFEGYRPQESTDGSGSIGFKLTPGPLRRLVDQARQHPEQVHVLIVDEINRANLAKVFGELYFLLEYRDEAIDLLYSSEEAFTLPKNVYLIGTMNTADRSIALVDSAMRRRFAFVSLHPSDEPVFGLLRRWLQREGLGAESALLLQELNRRIEDTDFKIGPSYLMRRSIYSTDKGLERVWRTSILPLLEEHHYGESKDLEKLYSLLALRKTLATASQAEDETATSE